VYDLPAHLREPCHWPLTCLLHAAAERSPHRTLDASEADYFWVPNKMPVSNDTELREILAFVVQRHPWFNATVAAGTSRHIMVFSCDHGPAPCTWAEAPCPGELWPDAVNPAVATRNLMFLGPNGVRDGADAGGGCCSGCFQRGKDIVLPPMTPGRDWDPDVARAGSLSPWLGSAAEAEAFVRDGTPRAGAPARDKLLWFAGAVTGASAAGDTTGRAAPFAAWSGDASVELLDTAKHVKRDRAVTFEDWAPRGVFCLDPMGTHGGWAARAAPLLYHGCLPLNTRPANVALIFEEHPAVRWDGDGAFAVSVPAPMGPAFNASLQEALREASRPSALRRRREAARRVYTRFLWTGVQQRSLAGEPQGGGADAWDTLMDILAARL
jgi:hypothetical protein